MARAGIPDVFVINELVGPEKTRAVALLAREAPLQVAVDDAGQVQGLSAAAVEAGSTIGVLVDVDDGHAPLRRRRRRRRRWPWPAASPSCPGLAFLGITGYEGHCSLDESDPDKRHDHGPRGDGDYFAGIADRLGANGLPCRDRLGRRHGHLGARRCRSRLTEIQPGSYATMDGHHRTLEPRFEQATTVLATCDQPSGRTAS